MKTTAIRDPLDRSNPVMKLFNKGAISDRDKA